MKIIYLLIVCSFVYSECDDYSQTQCSNDNNCEWVEDIESGNCSDWSYYNTYNYNQCNAIDECEWSSYQIDCGTATGYSDCDVSAGCSYSWLTFTCSGWTTISECSGGNYEIDNGSCQEIEMPDCSEMSFLQCSGNDNCDWIEDVLYGNCGNLTVGECYSYPGECYVDSNPGWYDSSGPYCTGGTYQIEDNSYCEEIQMPDCSEEFDFECNDGSCIPIHRLCNGIVDCEDGSDEANCGDCSDLNELNCNTDNSCEWVEDTEWANCSVFDDSESSCTSYSGECYWDEDITYGSCNGYDNNQWACNNAQGCYWDCYYGYCGCNGQEITGVDTECIGQYEIDNSYCEEIVMPECSEMNETECSSDDSCDWVEDIEWGNCDNYNSSASCHNAHEDCWWDLCYGGYYGQWSHCCRGGSFQIDNSYCEEVEYQLGDINGDYIINVLDIIEVINLVLDNEYNYIVDMNNDLDVNVLDIIELVNIILNGEGF